MQFYNKWCNFLKMFRVIFLSRLQNAYITEIKHILKLHLKELIKTEQ